MMGCLRTRVRKQPIITLYFELETVFKSFYMLNLSEQKNSTARRVAEFQIFEKTYLIVIKDETGLKFKMNDSTLFLIGSYAQKLVASC